jgi:hypothetical protein
MCALFVFLSLLLGADESGTDRLPEVSGVIATSIQFKDTAKEKVAEAGLALLASCHYWHVPSEGEMPKWDSTVLDLTQSRCHLYFRFAKPRTIKPIPSETVEVSEMIIVLPLSNGTIWVRSGDKAKRFAKYESYESVRLQAVLKDADPVVE